MLVPLMKEGNWRVEVDYSASWAICRNEKDAKQLAAYIMQLQGITAKPVRDVYYECPNCKSTSGTAQELRGCCDASL